MNYLKPVFLAILIFLGSSSIASATLFIDILDFPDATTAADDFSGNQENFRYHHKLPAIHPTKLESAWVTLTHKGNQGIGPTKEIWSIASGDGEILGDLSESTFNETTDTWQISLAYIRDLLGMGATQIPIILTEQTPFNREKITLLESSLTLSFQNSIPSTPEPSVALLLLAGAILTLFGRTKFHEK